MRAEKTTIVEDLSARLNSSPFLDCHGSNGNERASILRAAHTVGRSRRSGRVVKNTSRRAATEVGYPDLADNSAVRSLL